MIENLKLLNFVCLWRRLFGKNSEIWQESVRKQLTVGSLYMKHKKLFEIIIQQLHSTIVFLDNLASKVLQTTCSLASVIRSLSLSETPVLPTGMLSTIKTTRSVSLGSRPLSAPIMSDVNSSSGTTLDFQIELLIY